jgi:hypothetical protein
VHISVADAKGQPTALVGPATRKIILTRFTAKPPGLPAEEALIVAAQRGG